jgi:hypothetical protein
MNNLTQELTRSGEETNASADIPEQTFQNIRKQCTQNEIGMQENDSEFFIIDVAGQASNGANRSESDEDESDDSRNALDNLFKVDTVGKDGQNDDSDTEYDSDDDNCVIGKIIFINFLMCITLLSGVSPFCTCILQFFRQHKQGKAVKCLFTQ